MVLLKTLGGLCVNLGVLGGEKDKVKAKKARLTTENTKKTRRIQRMVLLKTLGGLCVKLGVLGGEKIRTMQKRQD
jgi:hypothetical protein